MKRAKVLVVEDDSAQRLILKKAFEEAEVQEFRSAGSGTAGLQVFDTYQPDAVVVDIMLPVLNGVDMARAMRATRPGLAVVGYSSVTRTLEPHDLAAFDEFVSRRTSTDPREVVAAVQRALDTQRALARS